MRKSDLLAAFGEIQQRSFVVMDADVTDAQVDAAKMAAEAAMLRGVLALFKSGSLFDYKVRLHEMVDELTDEDAERVFQMTIRMARPDFLKRDFLSN